jgi:hypothetical protein
METIRTQERWETQPEEDEISRPPVHGQEMAGEAYPQRLVWLGLLAPPGSFSEQGVQTLSLHF